MQGHNCMCLYRYNQGNTRPGASHCSEGGCHQAKVDTVKSPKKCYSLKKVSCMICIYIYTRYSHRYNIQILSSIICILKNNLYMFISIFIYLYMQRHLVPAHLFFPHVHLTCLIHTVYIQGKYCGKPYIILNYVDVTATSVEWRLLAIYIYMYVYWCM